MEDNADNFCSGARTVLPPVPASSSRPLVASLSLPADSPNLPTRRLPPSSRSTARALTLCLLSRVSYDKDIYSRTLLTSYSIHSSRSVRQPASSWHLARPDPVRRAARSRWLRHGSPERWRFRRLPERRWLHEPGSPGPAATVRPWIRRLPGLESL
jgi:hypothetical protein